MTRFQFDYSLLSALLDHWRLETHTFHFTVGEMTVTLQDTLLLMGLHCEGEPLRAANISIEWHTEFLSRFANTHGLTLTWLQQFSVRTFTLYFSSVLIIRRQ
jgi:hypothetical protein